MPKNKVKSLLAEEMINQQSAARSTSSTKQHKPILVSCVPTRPLALGRQTITATESGTAITKHAILERLFSGRKNTKQTRTMRYGTNACHSLVSSVDTFDFSTTFAWRSLTTGGATIFFPYFFVSKMYGTPSLHAIKYVVGKSILCGSYSYVRTLKYIACTRVQTMSICPSLYNTTLGPPGTQRLAMLLFEFFWGSNCDHYYLLLVLIMHPLATSISMYVCTCTYTEIQ